jgi:hypothetical protein
MSPEVHTFDVKIIDASTGELLFAIHNRTTNSVKGKGNGIKRDIEQWADDFSEYLTD